MKILVLLLSLVFSFSALSHCGVCGTGEAKDHKTMGGDDSHHDEDQEYAAEKTEKNDGEEDEESDSE